MSSPDEKPDPFEGITAMQLAMKEGATLVVKTSERLSLAAQEQLKARIKSEMPGDYGVLIFPPDTEVSIIDAASGESGWSHSEPLFPNTEKP